MPKITDYISKGGDGWLRPSEVSSGTVVTVEGAGVLRPANETPFNKEVFELPIKLPNGSVKNWTANKTTLKRLVEVWGDDTAKWVGKQIRIEVVKQNIRGQVKDVIYGFPVIEETEELKQYIDELKKIYGSRPLTIDSFEALLKARGFSISPQTVIAKFNIKTQDGKVILS